MNQPQQQDTTLSNEQIAQAANAGLSLLQRESTLIPGSLRQQLAVLEMVLSALTQGQIVVVSAEKPPVESMPEDVTDLTGPEDANDAPDQTPAEAG